MRTVQFAVAALLLVAPSAVALAQSNPPDPGKLPLPA